eukprot:8918078-Lingulodinium_polyedra.AAC.1
MLGLSWLPSSRGLRSSSLDWLAEGGCPMWNGTQRGGRVDLETDRSGAGTMENAADILNALLFP